MAMGVGRGKILMTPSDSPGSKIRGRCKQHTIIFYGDRLIELYCFEISIGCNADFATFEWLLWQQGLLGVNSNYTIRLPDPENRG